MGSIAAINYGVRIPSFAVSIMVLALGNVLLPYFSRLSIENLTNSYSNLYRILKWLFLASLGVTLILIFFSSHIIELVFERGEFDAQDTEVVSVIMQIALAYVPFYLCTLICVKFLTSINKNKFMAWTSMWNFGLNLVLNIILIRSMGLYGLVLSTTFVYIISFFVYLSYVHRGKLKAMKEIGNTHEN